MGRRCNTGAPKDAASKDCREIAATEKGKRKRRWTGLAKSTLLGVSRDRGLGLGLSVWPLADVVNLVTEIAEGIKGR